MCPVNEHNHASTNELSVPGASVRHRDKDKRRSTKSEVYAKKMEKENAGTQRFCLIATWEQSLSLLLNI